MARRVHLNSSVSSFKTSLWGLRSVGDSHGATLHVGVEISISGLEEDGVTPSQVSPISDTDLSTRTQVNIAESVRSR
jgi:hypothetical protein